MYTTCRYGLPELSDACLSVLIASVDVDNVTHYALLAHQHGCESLAQARMYMWACCAVNLIPVLCTPSCCCTPPSLTHW